MWVVKSCQVHGIEILTIEKSGHFPKALTPFRKIWGKPNMTAMSASQSSSGANASESASAEWVHAENWPALIGEHEWSVFSQAIQEFEKAEIPFLLAGAFGLANYTGRLRNTKDLDFCITPENRDRAIECLSRAGFDDYFQTLAYDRAWIYRSHRENLILDIIWSMANQRASVSEHWFIPAPSVMVGSTELKIVPPEYLIWMKLYVLQKDRSDWLDIVNLLYSTVEELNWGLLVDIVGLDLPLLSGVMQVFNWVCPGKTRHIPAHFKELLQITNPCPSESTELPDYDLQRIRLLDSRPWFAAIQPVDRLMRI